ncbi:MAG: hypothetical protein ACRETN_09000 [Nevskiales bacterium]
MSDAEIQKAIDRYLHGRHELLELSRKHPNRIGGNDNIIGRVGEFIGLRFLEGLGQNPAKVKGNSNPGYDFIEGDVQTQVKVITEENQKGRNVRLTEPWTQLVFIELGEHYKPRRVGLLTKAQFQQARLENPTWSGTPFVKRTMLGPKGLISRYGRVYQGSELAV